MAGITQVKKRAGNGTQTFWRFNGKDYTTEREAKAAQTADSKKRNATATTAAQGSAILKLVGAGGKPTWVYHGTEYPTLAAAQNAKKTNVTPPPSSSGLAAGDVRMADMQYDPPGSQPRIDIHDRNQVIWRQTELKNLGADIEVDGVWGPKTAMLDAAVREGTFVAPRAQDAPDASPTAARGATTPRSSSSLSAPPQSAAGGAYAPAPTPLNPAEFRAQVTAAYPALAGLLDIPDIAREVDKAIANKSTPDELAANIQATAWWRSTPQVTRQWIALHVTDPATADRQVEDNKTALKALADQYFVPMADVTLTEWSKKVLSGEVPQAAFEQYVKEQAKSLFPSLSGAIDAGVTVAHYADPYKQIAAQTLEIAPDAVNFNDPKWGRALMQVNKDGERTSMSLYDWTNLLKTDAAYGYDRTTQARSQAAQIADRINQTFGRVG